MPSTRVSEDNTWLLHCTALGLGASCLTPWLAYISAADFFIAVYPKAHLMYVFPVQNMGILFFGCFVMMRFGERVSLTTRVLVPFFALLITMSMVPILNMVGVSKPLALVVTIASQLIGSCMVTVVQQSSYGAGGFLGPQFTNALEVGKGIGGLIIILARVILKALLPPTPAGLEASTNIFFISSLLIIATTIVLWKALVRSPLASKKISQYEEQRRRSLCLTSPENGPEKANNTIPPPSATAAAGAAAVGTREETTTILSGDHLKSSPQRQQLIDIEMASPRSTSGQRGEKVRGGEKVQLLLDAPPSGNNDQPGDASMKVVLSKVAGPAWVVCSTFTVCLACFPGMTTSLVSPELGDWFPVLLVLAYNVADLLGKSLAGHLQLFSGTTIVLPAVIHMGFIPLFVALVRSADPSTLACFVTVATLGLSTGYVATSCMMLGPQCVPPSDKVMAGQVMSTCLIAGLFIGSLVGVVLGVAVAS